MGPSDSQAASAARPRATVSGRRSARASAGRHSRPGREAEPEGEGHQQRRACESHEPERERARGEGDAAGECDEETARSRGQQRDGGHAQAAARMRARLRLLAAGGAERAPGRHHGEDGYHHAGERARLAARVRVAATAPTAA